MSAHEKEENHILQFSLWMFTDAKIVCVDRLSLLPHSQRIYKVRRPPFKIISTCVIARFVLL